MPGNIYYLIASLPYLCYPDPPSITIDEFLSICNTHLSRSRLDKLKSISRGETDHAVNRLSVVRMWQEWDLAARGELARLRAERLGRLVEAMVPEGKIIVSAIEAAREAYRAHSPMEADDVFETARWAYIDSLEFGRYFNMEWLALYLLKLKVLERRARLVTERGRVGLELVLEGCDEEIGALMEGDS